MLSSPVSISFCFGSSLELTPIDAPAHGPRFLPISIGAPRVHLPAKAARHPERLDFHENKNGTTVGVVNPLADYSQPLAVLARSTVLAVVRAARS
jgi:hypothetical protein